MRMKNVDIPDHAGQTALHIASTRSEYCTKKLLDAVLSPLATTYEGLTPLHFAARAQQSNIVGMLVRSLQKASHPKSRTDTDTSVQNDADARVGIDGINARDEEGLSSLYYAVRSGRPETVKILLEAGANVNTGGDLFQACSEYEDDNAFRAATCHVTHDPLTQRETKEDASDPHEGASPFTSAKPEFSAIETSRLEEIVVSLVDYGVDASQLRPKERSHDGGLIRRYIWHGKAYTASCLFDQVPLSLWAEPSMSAVYTALLATSAPAYDSSVSSKYFIPAMAGRLSRIEFNLFMR